MRGSLAAVFHHRVIIGGRKEITGSRRIEFAQTRRKRRTKKKNTRKSNRHAQQIIKIRKSLAILYYDGSVYAQRISIE